MVAKQTVEGFLKENKGQEASRMATTEWEEGGKHYSQLIATKMQGEALYRMVGSNGSHPFLPSRNETA